MRLHLLLAFPVLAAVTLSCGVKKCTSSADCGGAACDLTTGLCAGQTACVSGSACFGHGEEAGSEVCAELLDASRQFFEAGDECEYLDSGGALVKVFGLAGYPQQCVDGFSQACSTADENELSLLAGCVARAPSCAVGAEARAGEAFEACREATSLSASCKDRLQSWCGGAGRCQ